MNTLIRSHLLISRKAHDFLLAQCPDMLASAKSHSEELRWSVGGLTLTELPYELARDLKDFLPASMQSDNDSKILSHSDERFENNTAEKQQGRAHG